MSYFFHDLEHEVWRQMHALNHDGVFIPLEIGDDVLQLLLDEFALQLVALDDSSLIAQLLVLYEPPFFPIVSSLEPQPAS